MKLNRKTIAALIICFCAIAMIVGIPSLFEGNTEYKASLNTARNYYENNLCALSIQSFQKAIKEKDSLNVELELADAYIKGVKNGEIKHLYDVNSFFNNLLTNYKDNSKAYEKALLYYISNDDFESAAAAIEQAESRKVSSDEITAVKDILKSKYETRYSMATQINRTTQGTYIVEDSEKYYIYNDDFNPIVSDFFDYASVFINGTGLVKKDGYTYLIDEAGVRQAYFDNNITNSTGVGCELIACKINKIYSYYNLKGEEQFGEYSFASRFKNDIAAVKTSEGWQIIDTSGKSVDNRTYDDIKLGLAYECCSGDVVFAKIGDKYAMYDSNMKQISDFECEDCDVFLSDKWLAAVKIDGKWGFINTKGEIVIEPQFDSAKSFSNGLAAVKIGDECFFIDSNAEKIIAGEFDEGDYFNDNGLCLVKNKTFWQPIKRYYMEK